MAENGYRFRGEHGIPGRLYFDRLIDGLTVVHAHMFPVGHSAVQDHLKFRDHLRTRPAAVQEYELLKRGLAERNQGHRTAYTDGKADFIARILRECGF